MRRNSRDRGRSEDDIRQSLSPLEKPRQLHQDNVINATWATVSKGRLPMSFSDHRVLFIRGSILCQAVVGWGDRVIDQVKIRSRSVRPHWVRERLNLVLSRIWSISRIDLLSRKPILCRVISVPHWTLSHHGLRVTILSLVPVAIIVHREEVGVQ